MRTIRTRKLDPHFVKDVIGAGGENILSCFQCGACVGGCPAGRATPYRMRRIIGKARLGLKEEVLSSRDLWLCTTCYTCYERCPRDANPTDVILALRNLAVKKGYCPENFKNSVKTLVDSGHLVPLLPEVRRFRKELSIDEIPPTAIKSKKALREVKRILEIMGTAKLVGLR